MPAPIANTSRSGGRVAVAEAPPPPEPGFLDGLAANFTAARDDQLGRLQDEQVSAYAPVINALDDMGLNGSRYVFPARSGAQVNYSGVWSMVDEARRRDPRALADLPATQAEFETRWRDQFRERAEQTEQTAARAGIVPRLAGGFAGAMTDPINLATLPVGGVGKTALMRVATEALANGVIEAAQQPLINAERAEQGRRGLTGEQMAYNIGGAALFGGVVRGGIEVAPHIGSSFVKAVTAKRAQLPQALRDRWDASLLSRANPTDDPQLLADLTKVIVGDENFSDVERAAAIAAQREAQLDNASPFRPTGAGADMHDALAAEAFRAALHANPFATSASTTALARSMPPVARAPVESGVDRFMAKTRSAESTGDDAIRNPRSSAQGRYQFTNRTWLAYYKRRFGAGGLDDAAILAKKTDGNLQDVLMRDLTDDNAAKLRRAGHAANEGNLYLAHFAGPEGARKVLDADPRASVEGLLGKDVIKANPFLKDKDAGWLVDWAHSKMGSSREAGTLEVRADVGSEAASMQAAVDSALDRSARLAAEDRAARSGQAAPVGEALDGTLTPIERTDLPEPDALPTEPRALDADAPRAEVLAILPKLRDVVDGRERSINQLDSIAKDLGATEQDVREGLSTLVREGRLSMNRKTGHYMRKPAADTGPEDVLEFIARNGGIRDDEGHALGLRGISEKERRELHPAAIKNVKRRREGGGKRDWQRMTRRNGPLLRHEGRSVDAVGEVLWEAGYLRGADSERPTTREVLEFLDQRINEGKPVYPMGESREAMNEAPAWETEWDHLQHREAIDDFRTQWAEFGHDPADLDDALLARAAELYRDGTAFLPEHAVELAARERIAAVAGDLIDETGDNLYHDAHVDPFDPRYWDDPEPSAQWDATDWNPEWEFQRGEYLRDDGGNAGTGRQRSSGQRGDAGAGRTGRTSGAGAGQPYESGEVLANLPAAERSPFLDPEGAAARAQADSLEHDARAAEAADAAFREVWADKPFQRATKVIGNVPHRESAVARSMADGWRAAESGDLAPVEAIVAKIAQSDAYIPQGFNPSQGFLEGFYARVTGEPVEIRAIGGERVSREGKRVIDAETALEDLRAHQLREAGDNPPLDPGVAERQAQEAQMRADAPLRGENATGAAQDGTMGLGLFDAADQPSFRLDVEGDARTLKDILDELDAEATELKNIRDCL